jgi:hypothetical protein
MPIEYSIEYIQATDEMVHVAVCAKCCTTLAIPVRGEMCFVTRLAEVKP